MEIEKFLLENYKDIDSLGYVVEVFDNDKEYEYVVGNSSLKPQVVKASSNTLYDIASITKMFTATLVYMAYEEGLIDLKQTVYSIDSNFINLKDVTIYDLLGHSQEVYTDGYLGIAKDASDFMKILYSSYVINKKHKYVDVHYIILSTLLEKIYNKPFNVLVLDKIINKLGLKNTKFSPTENECAPCNFEFGKEDIKPGIVHDKKARRARELGIYTGHAGLFATGKDILTFLKTFLDCELLKEDTIKLMLKHDGDNNYNHMSCRCRKEISKVLENFSDESITYSGFTGPMFVMDFKRRLIILVMCNTPHNAIYEDSRSNRRETIAKLIKDLKTVIDNK